MKHEDEGLARHEGDIAAGARAELTFEELAAIVRKPLSDTDREDAIACYLSASDGWDEAVKLLGGAFAEDMTGLKARKDD